MSADVIINHNVEEEQDSFTIVSPIQAVNITQYIGFHTDNVVNVKGVEEMVAYYRDMEDRWPSS